MAQAIVCDRCGKVLKYAPDIKIKIYYHPYGDMYYELCPKCTEELKRWLNSEKSWNKETK